MSHDRGCAACGKEPYEYGDCKEPACMKSNRTMAVNSEKRYVLVGLGGTTAEIYSQKELESSDVNTETYTIYELGPEVEIKKQISIEPKNTVYRDYTNEVKGKVSD